MKIFIDVDDLDDKVGERRQRRRALVGGLDGQVVELLHFVVETARYPDCSRLIVDLKVFLLALFLNQGVPEINNLKNADSFIFKCVFLCATFGYFYVFLLLM